MQTLLRRSSSLCTLALACAATAALASPALAQIAVAAQTAAVEAVAQEVQEPGLTKAQIDALLASPEKVLVLDVRRADEISEIGGFPAFLNIQADQLERHLAYIPRDRRILTVSNHAGRARKAAALLRSAGFQVAGIAGAQDYETQGGVLVGKKPGPTAVAGAPGR